MNNNIIIKIQFETKYEHHLKIIAKNILNRDESFVKHNYCIVCPKFPINNAKLTNLSTKLSKKIIKLTNVIADLNKFDQTTNEFTTDNEDSIIIPIMFIENSLNKIDQTINEFPINDDDLTNLSTKFTEFSDTNVPNVIDLKRVYQTTNKCTMNKMILPTFLPSLQKIMIRTYQM